MWKDHASVAEGSSVSLQLSLRGRFQHADLFARPARATGGRRSHSLAGMCFLLLFSSLKVSVHSSVSFPVHVGKIKLISC